MNMQREVIYKQRAQVLEGEDLKRSNSKYDFRSYLKCVLSHLNGVEGDDVEVEMKKLIAYLDDICVPDNRVTVEELMKITNDEIIEKYKNIATEIYNGKEEEFGSEKMREIERVILLRTVDSKWMNHIDNMDHLKQGMGLRAFKQQDPVQAYQMEGSQMFDEMIQGIKTRYS